jgi:hypothetical protein
VNQAFNRPQQSKANSGGWDAARPSPRPEALTMPPGTGASVRNKANSPSRLAAWGQLYKQSQSGSAAERATSPRCPASGNKANSRHAVGMGKGFAAKESWLIVQSTGRGKTKPIPPGGTRPAELPAELSLGRDAPNKPNLCQRGRWDVVQTKPIEGGPAGIPESIVQNEPNSRLRRGGRGLGDAGRGANAQNRAN